jgi:hypothetical protein
VLIAHGFPDILEGIDVELALAGCEGIPIGSGGDTQEGHAENPEAEKHLFNIT